MTLIALGNVATWMVGIKQCHKWHLRRTRPVSALDRRCDGMSKIDGGPACLGVARGAKPDAMEN